MRAAASMNGPLPSKRLLSLDVFRGATIAAMILVNNPGSWSHVYRQLDHAEWNGWTLTDTIFPFFLFIVGVSMAFSMPRTRLDGPEAGRPRDKSGIYARVSRRALILFALGLFLNGFPKYDWTTLRVMGVLQRISVCYLVASVVYLELELQWQIAAAALLLFVYWGFMAFYPVPGVGAGALEKGRNFAAYVDQLVLRGHMWANTKTWDPEGIVSTIPAVSTVLFGVFAGRWLRGERSGVEKARGLLIAGALGLLAGRAWGIWLPINKNLWTCSYSVFMSGFASAALGACYYVIDVKGRRGWTQPFAVFGTNAIAVFVLAGIAARILGIWKVAVQGHPLDVKTFLYKTLFASWLSPINASLSFAAAFLVVLYFVMLPLYRKRIFIKV